MQRLALASLLWLALGHAGPVSFTGSAGVYSEYDWVSGDALVKPRPELRLVINPSLSLWNFPIGMNILLSTQENPVRQQLDKFKLFFNPKQWLESQADMTGFAWSFKSLELGSCNPSWTSYTLSGTPVLGCAVELTPWYLYAAAAAGRNQRRVPVSDSTQGAYARMLYSARLGFGKKEGTHFYLTALYAGDDTIPPASNWQPNPNDAAPPIDSFEVVRPEENYVLGAEFNLVLAGGAFRLESEAAACEVTRDRRLPAERWDWIPGWAASAFKPRISSSADYALKARPVLHLANTKLYGKVEMVGPGFQSFGAPGLRNDILIIGGGIERSFFDDAVSVAAAYSSQRDNLVSAEDSAGNVLRLKNETTRFTNWETSLGITFPNLPHFQLGYYPYAQGNDSSLMKGTVLSVSAGHGFQTGKVSHSPGFSFGYNDVRSPVSDSTDNTSWDAGLNYGLGFEFPLSLSASCGYSQSEAATDTAPDNRFYFDLTPSYTVFQKWTHSLSVGGTFGTARRIETRYSSSFPVWRLCDASVGISDAIYKGDDGKYNDLRLTAELSKSW
jgi:hypothetical protein